MHKNNRWRKHPCFWFRWEIIVAAVRQWKRCFEKLKQPKPNHSQVAHFIEICARERVWNGFWDDNQTCPQRNKHRQIRARVSCVCVCVSALLPGVCVLVLPVVPMLDPPSLRTGLVPPWVALPDPGSVCKMHHCRSWCVSYKRARRVQGHVDMLSFGAGGGAV